MTKATPARDDFETHLKTLVDKFERHRADYLRPDYSEAQVRVDFINPFFEALGWDVQDHAALGRKERQVVVEKGETTGNPDYNFRHEGRTVFFVEAKAPHVPLDSTDVVMQAKTYAWNSPDVFLAAITDFEGFRLYDATPRPDRRHPDVGLIFAYRCGEYLQPKVLDDLWLLSLESVAGGSIDRLLKRSTVLARQKIPVDQAFLDDLTGWREQLAKAAYKNDPEMAVADLNSVVQVFLDRLIFLRLAEDRGILPPRGLEDITRAWEHSGKRRSIRDGLNDLFREVNLRLNGEIFKPHRAEKIDWDSCADLVAKIIAGLYPPSPYRFDVIGVELLGSIYERYLGKTIRVTPTRAMVEDKPEVRKAGGVYYTPKYIVDYIVEQTVGKLIEGKTPRQTLKLRVLDPACGSGSFLLAAYQRLIDHHERWYADQARKKRARRTQPALLAEGEGGEFRLSLAQKAEILRNCIFGVDIDPQAVEITMMSLYIKMLEGEKGAIAGRGVLPPLRDNIKCGNSLISHDIARQPALFGNLSPADLDRINPFDWESKSEGFGEILEEGGFDVVIGNPPYILLQSEFRDDVQLAYFRSVYEVASFKVDTYHLFVERGIRLTSPRGRFSMIIPANILTNNHLAPLRRFLLRECQLDHVLVIDKGVFRGVSVDSAILVTNGRGPTADAFCVKHSKLGGKTLLGVRPVVVSPGQTLRDENALFTGASDAAVAAIWEKVIARSTKLGQIAYVNFGKQLRDRKRHPRDVMEVANLASVPPTHRPCYTGRDVSRYAVDWGHLVCLDDEVARAGGCWDPAAHNALNKMLTRQVGVYPEFAIDRRGYHCLNTMFMVNLHDQQLAPVFVLGVLNSGLVRRFWLDRYYDQRRTFPKIKGTYLKQLPICRVDVSNPEQESRYAEMVALVERMLELHKQKQASASDAARARIEREIHVTDEKIDALVYELYDLTDEEIRIVEELA